MLQTLLSHPNRPKVRSILLLLLTMVLLGYGVWATIAALRPSQSTLRLGTGQAGTRRFQIAEFLSEEAAEQGLAVELVPSTSGRETLTQWQSGDIQLAILSSGISLPEVGDVQVVAGLNFEPLHILVRRNSASDSASWLERFRGRTINLGELGSNDYQLGSELLRYLRLTPKDYTTSNLSKEELITRAREIGPPWTQPCILGAEAQYAERERKIRALPDVILLVAPVPSVAAQAVLDTGDYELLSFPYAHSFISSDLHHERPHAGQLDRACLETASIPASTYLGHTPLPASDCQTVGLRSILVAKASVPKTAIKHLMQSILLGDFARRVEPVSPKELMTPHTIHPGAIAFLNRNNPIVTEAVVDVAGNALGIFGAFSAGALTLYGYVKRKRIRRPEEYLEEIRKVDRLMASQAQEHLHHPANEQLLHELDQRLVKLKERLIHDYCGNRVQGEMVLLSILSMLADTRSRLHGPVQARGDVLPMQAAESTPRPAAGKDLLRNLRPAA